MGKRNKSKGKANSNTKTAIKKKSLESRTFRKLSSSFATTLSVVDEKKQRIQQQQKQQQQQQRNQSLRAPGETSISLHKPVEAQATDVSANGAAALPRESSELNTSYQNLMEREFVSVHKRARSKKEHRRLEQALKRKERQSRDDRRTPQQMQQSSSGNTAPALACLKLFSFQPATFNLATKTTTDLLNEATSTFRGVGLQEEQAAARQRSTATGPAASAMLDSLQPPPTATGFLPNDNHSNAPSQSSNPFQALQSRDEDEKPQPAVSMPTFSFSPATFTLPASTTLVDGDIDPDL